MISIISYVVYVVYFIGILFYRNKMVSYNFKLKEKYQLGFNEFQRFDEAQFTSEERTMLIQLNHSYWRWTGFGLLIVFMFTVIINIVPIILERL